MTTGSGAAGWRTLQTALGPREPAAYRIRVSAPAFRAVDRLVHAVPGLEPLALTLALEGLEESVDIVDTAGEFAIDALSSLTATPLSGDELLGLPADEEDLATCCCWPARIPPAIWRDGRGHRAADHLQGYRQHSC